MANHYRVSPKFWIKARRRGWTDAQTTLALYLLTCEHRNLEGLYRLPKPYIAADLGWPARKVEETLATVCDSGFAVYDDDAGMVLIPKALKHQAPSTDNQIKGAIAQLERIPRTSLWDAFRMASASHCPRLADAIAMRWPSHGRCDTQCDADASSRARAGSRAPASSSISSSISNPPQPPEGGRQRDLSRFAREMHDWAEQHYPDLPPDAVAGAVQRIRAGRGEVTPERVREYATRVAHYLPERAA